MEKIRNAKVLAAAFYRETGEPAGSPREEEIVLAENEMFKDCKTIVDIHRRYESFWNDLNPDSDAVVFVQSIRINQDY